MPLPLQVIGAGVGRTGTSSLTAALSRLLGGPCYHFEEVIRSPEHVALWRRALGNELHDWEAIFSGYAATTDWPGAAFWEPLSHAYPDALVVLSTRNSAEEWFASARATIGVLVGELPPKNSTDGPWLEMSRELLGARFVPAPFNEQEAIAAYERHNAAVRAAVDPRRLVEWRPGDGWKPLCEALELPVPVDAFPHLNSRSDFIEALRAPRASGLRPLRRATARSASMSAKSLKVDALSGKATHPAGASGDSPYLDVPRADMIPFIPPSASSVLDVGCGRGGFGAELKRQRPKVHVTGLEPNEDAASVAASRYDRVIVGRFPESISDGEFDCIVFNDVLEHMVDPWTALKQAAAMLTRNGCVVASIPNLRYLPVLLGLLRGRFSYADSGVLDRTHLRFFTQSSITEMFVEAGYVVDQMRPTGQLSLRTVGWLRRSLLLGLGILKPRMLADLRCQQFGVVAYAAKP